MWGWIAMAAALAQDAATPETPLPIEGAPWSVQATAYAVPPPDPAWITTEERFHTCRVLVALLKGSEPRYTPVDCPETFAAAAVAATSQWKFEPPADASGETTFEIDYVARYEEKLGSLSIHAEVDPGEDEAFAGAVGAPGVKLVHPAKPTKTYSPKVPGPARKAGVQPTTCPARVQLDTRGKVAQVELGECPEALRAAAEAAALKWRFTPRVVDANTEPDVVPIEIAFR
jgi:hypothetical protein